MLRVILWVQVFVSQLAAQRCLWESTEKERKREGERERGLGEWNRSVVVVVVGEWQSVATLQFGTGACPR